MSVDGAVPASVSALFGTCLYVSVALLVALSVGLSVSQLVVFVSSLFASSLFASSVCVFGLSWPLFGRSLAACCRLLAR